MRPDPSETVQGDQRVIFGWAMYDWANSAYVTTTAVAVLPMYFAGVVVPPGGLRIGSTPVAAETLWGFMVSAAALFVFVLAPVLGAVADFAAAKKRFLLSFCALGVFSAALLSLCGPGAVWPTMLLFVLAQIGFVGGNVFYDAFLPQIAAPGDEDRVSSKGYAFGYVGGGLQFATSLLLIAFHDTLGLSAPAAARLAMLGAALWWGGFALVTARLLREPRNREGEGDTARSALFYLCQGFARVRQTMNHVRRLRGLALFLLAFLVYNEGIQTVIQMATMYGKQELGLGSTALMGTLLLVQVVGIFGALLFGRIAGMIGSKHAIMLSLGIWCGVVVYGYFIDSAAQYFILGGIIGLVLGGSQAISRSFYAAMIPAGSPAEFFGFYSVVSKFSAIWGPFLFAMIRHFSGSSRNALLSIIIFFILGLILLSFVTSDSGRRAGGAVGGGRAVGP